MNDNELKQIRSLAHDIGTKYPERVVCCAVMLRIMAEATGTDESDAAYDSYAKIAGRIEAEMHLVDESRFTMYDYADGIANAARAVDPEKLLAMDRDGFAESLIWLACYKRETYEDRPHTQPPLAHDIFAGGTP